MSSASNLKYFVGGVPSDVRHKDLYDFFRKYGVVKRITVFNSENSKKLFGFCFVKFKKVYGGELDIHNTEFVFQGRKLEIDHIIRRSNLKQSVQDKHSKRVFLQNVPPTFEKGDLIDLFSPFGSISNCFTINRNPQQSEAKVKIDHRQVASKYGYVIFDHKEDAEELLKRRFVEVNNKTKIYIKRYCSTINRLTPEDEKAMQKANLSVHAGDKGKQSGPTLSHDERPRTIISDLLLHQVKPTSKTYHSGVCDWKQEQGYNLRFNISLI